MGRTHKRFVPLLGLSQSIPNCSQGHPVESDRGSWSMCSRPVLGPVHTVTAIGPISSFAAMTLDLPHVCCCPVLLLPAPTTPDSQDMLPLASRFVAQWLFLPGETYLPSPRTFSRSVHLDVSVLVWALFLLGECSLTLQVAVCPF